MLTPVLCLGQNTTEVFLEKYQLRDTLLVNQNETQVFQTPGQIEKFMLHRGDRVFGVRKSGKFILVFTLDDRYGYVFEGGVTLIGDSHMEERLVVETPKAVTKPILVDSLAAILPPTIKTSEAYLKELLEVSKRTENNTRVMKNIMVGMTILTAGLLIQTQLHKADAERQANRVGSL